MTDEQKPTPTPGADALAQEVADLLARRAGLPAQPAPEAAPVPADAPEPFKAAVASPIIARLLGDKFSNRVAALVISLLTIASRRLGIDIETLASIVEGVIAVGLVLHVWKSAK